MRTALFTLCAFLLTFTFVACGNQTTAKVDKKDDKPVDAKKNKEEPPSPAKVDKKDDKPVDAKKNKEVIQNTAQDKKDEKPPDAKKNREVTAKEIEVFGEDLVGQRCEIVCKFSEVSDKWVKRYNTGGGGEG